MKHIVFLTLGFLLACSLSAQQPMHERQQPRECPQDITRLVDDLSSDQKRKIDNISKESQERVDHLRKQQEQVRDSIGSLMNLDEDRSKEIFPLFDREARLQSLISREMYITKTRINQVLKPDQRKHLSERLAKRHKERMMEKGERKLEKVKRPAAR